MAPELFEKKSVYNPFKVDVWALGILLFYLYEGTYPFKGYCEKDLIKNIVSGVIIFKRSDNTTRELITSLLHLDPAARPDAQQLLSKFKY
jgi:MAP/microtubule affinity-regulating kinase